MRKLTLLLVAALSFSCNAQDQNAMSLGSAFGKSIVPTQPGQVVNPAGVNSSAWSGKLPRHLKHHRVWVDSQHHKLALALWTTPS